MAADIKSMIVVCIVLGGRQNAPKEVEKFTIEWALVPIKFDKKKVARYNSSRVHSSD